jgi:PKD repeat protein
LLSADNVILSNNTLPFAAISPMLNKYEDPTKTDFCGWRSMDPNGKVDHEYRFGVDYRWDFKNNGTWTEWSPDANASFTYGQLGTYTVKLQVKDADGEIAETTHEFTIHNNSAVIGAENITGPTTCKAGEEYNYKFTLIDPDGDRFNANIYFNDGNKFESIKNIESGTTINVTHTWRFPGKLKIYILVSDSYSSSKWICHVVNVEEN